MSKYAVFMLVAIIGMASSVASTLKPPAITALGDVKYSLYAYRMDRGRFPSSWNDFISSGHISPETLEYARKYCDLENRYFLFDGGKKAKDFGKEINIIIMAKSSGLEGDQVGSPDSVGVKGRFLFIEGPDHSVETRRCSEVELNRIFSDSGLRLSDYTVTFSGGENEESPVTNSKGSRNAPRKPDTKAPSNGINRYLTIPAFQSYWKWILGGMVLLFFVYIARNKSK